MASCPVESPLSSYVLRVKRMEPNLPDPAALERELTSLRTAFSRTRFQLPLQCTETPTRACCLFERLDALNEMLWFIGFEVSEVSPGRIAIGHLEDATVTGKNCDKDPIEYGAIVLHCLLAKHRCVRAVELVLPTVRQSTFVLLFCEALRSNESLTCLRLSQCDLRTRITACAIFVICRLLSTQLRELTLDSLQLIGDVWASLEVLRDGLAATSTLKMLKVVDVHVTGTGAGAAGGSASIAAIILDGLAGNTSVCSLAIDSWFTMHDNEEAFKRLLADSTTLSELSVTCARRCHEASSVFDALAANSSVTDLILEDFHIGQPDGESFAELLARNRTLKEVSFTDCSWDIWERNEQGEKVRLPWHIETLVEALKCTTSLRCLDVDCNLTLREVRLLLEAARDCASLKELHIASLHLTNLEPFCQALEETGTAHKVKVRSCTSSAQYLVPLVIGMEKAPPPVGQLRLNCVDNKSLHDACWALSNDSSQHVTSLHLHSTTLCVESDAAQELGSYLASTQCLRELDLKLPKLSPWSDLVVAGLAQNNSIQKLKIKGIFTSADVGVLCDWLTESQRLHNLEFWSTSTIAGLLVDTLAESLEESYALTRIKVVECWKNKLPWQRVKSLVRRNAGLVQCAAGFALGSELTRAALGYELVAPWHPQLLGAIQCMGSLTQVEAEKRMKSAARRIHSKFWQLAGIVYEELVCHELPPDTCGDGPTRQSVQLDQLPSRILEHICSYLKVSDVLVTKSATRQQ
ncbi:uncharacterized protein LOC119383854 isoform X1 [Rhipicephalus sanguineus]|uniref:uncharacterized protein LOC119383854 isoform X1 n=1 Tax=Rhipicephalus sanguineus TaxID=34632 RepID=UPI001894A6A7|nr:uncharacterized protein LOC119383854 isoform X1 [Rhipicephalus sanguineus]